MDTKLTNDVTKEVTNLNAGWYNMISQAMGITDPNFQVAQGALSISSTDSSQLFLMADTVPYPDSVYTYTPSGAKRSSAYTMLLQALLPESGSDLPAVLGDQYSNWVTYRVNYYKNTTENPLSQEKLFAQWSDQNLDPRKSREAQTAYKQAANSPLYMAEDQLTDPNSKQKFTGSDGSSFSLYKYSSTIDQAKNAISHGAKAELDFNSASMSTTINNAFSSGSTSGWALIFTSDSSSSYESMNSAAASSGFTVKGVINQYATIPVDPINWFNDGEFARAYHGKDDNSIWDPNANAGDWSSFFNDKDGSLAYRVAELLLISDYDITVTSEASYSQHDLEVIKQDKSVRVWPFYTSRESSSHTTEFSLSEEGKLVMHHSLNKGLIQVWGAISKKAPK